MWKDTIKKKSGDEEYEEGETLDSTNKIRDTRSAESYKTGDTTGRRSYTNKVRDTRSADSYKTGDTMGRKVCYDESLMRERLKAISEYTDGLVGKVFTTKEDMELNQLIMDLVNDYDGKPPRKDF